MNNSKKMTLEEHITSNYEAFEKMLFNERDKGKFALLRDGKLVEIMADKSDAHKLGKRIYKDGLYSIQEIMPKRDFGSMSYALC